MIMEITEEKKNMMTEKIMTMEEDIKFN